MKSVRMHAVILALALFAFAAPSFAASSGEEIYAKRCAMCHDQANERIPPRAVLQKLPASRIVRELNAGVMMAVGFTLSREDRIAVASYLGMNATESGPPASAFCADRTVKLAAKSKFSWNGWSPSSDDARFQPGDVARLSVDQVRNLKLKWAFGFDGDVIAFAPPTVIDDELFVGSASGMVHAMRADSGCLQWVFRADGPVRSSILAVPLGGQHALLFGDMIGWFYAVQAETGKLLWKTRVELHDSTRLTGGPAAYEGTVYVPVASWEETRAGDKEYACCTFRGSVVALNIKDGKQVWKTWMVDPPTERGKNARGVPIFGPSGVAVWSRPTIDAGRKLLYVGTGDNYSPPTTELSDAIVALDMATGHIAWSRQLTAKDFYNGSCLNDPNCGPDFDFGSSPIPVRTADGRELLLAGQKSGVVWALDPTKEGEVVWQARVGKGSTNGGVQWGMASDGQKVYAAVSDLVRKAPAGAIVQVGLPPDPTQGGGLTALRITNGEKAWYAAPKPCEARSPCSPAQPAAVTAIPGVVFSGSVDGHLRAFSTEDGRVVWDFNT
ncbi:MAG TPA: PQQ-binding-like beta-propeller repeat protein, partial [Candidatus Sulfopaludibacter sp.]|nr:PQQ-binding-like beta-propeller repeat protein [Candidatus Sulfopaludibacter sp.]